MSVSWVIGRGLLGSSVVSAIGSKQFEQTDLFSWNDPQELAREFSENIDAFKKASHDGPWIIYWTAGKSVMSTPKEDIVKETASLELFLKLLKDRLTTKGTFVLASSAGAIYAGSQDEIINEISDTKPLNAYGEEKLRQEEIVKAWATQTGSSAFLARIANLYGPGQSKGKKQGLISHIARSMLTHKPIHIYVPLDTMRDYIHVHDAAADIVHVTQLLEPGTVLTKIIASEESTTIAAIVGVFRKITRRQPLVVTGASNMGAVYSHRTEFRSTVMPHARAPKRTSLLNGIASVLGSERLHLND